jgi:hypothetical protein
MEDRKYGIAAMMNDAVSLPSSTEQLYTNFKSAQPFPHLVLENLFPSEILDNILEEIPPMTDEKWVHDQNAHVVKSNLRSAVHLGKKTEQFVAFVHSAKFLYLLSELTGVKALLPDPYLGGGGYHVVPVGGKFDVHADRNIDQNSGLARRLSVLIYLNKEWKPEYGGQLELWDKSGSRCEKVIEPTFNRTVIFQITDQNFHGVRPVLALDRARKAFVLYYHTVPSENLIPHQSIYAPSLYLTKEPLHKRLLKDLSPPLLLRAFKRVRTR